MYYYTEYLHCCVEEDSFQPLSHVSQSVYKYAPAFSSFEFWRNTTKKLKILKHFWREFYVQKNITSSKNCLSALFYLSRFADEENNMVTLAIQGVSNNFITRNIYVIFKISWKCFYKRCIVLWRPYSNDSFILLGGVNEIRGILYFLYQYLIDFKDNFNDLQQEYLKVIKGFLKNFKKQSNPFQQN